MLCFCRVIYCSVNMYVAHVGFLPPSSPLWAGREGIMSLACCQAGGETQHVVFHHAMKYTKQNSSVLQRQVLW
jgi:hypothetical protein